MLPYFIANIIAISFMYIGYSFKLNNLALKFCLVLSAIPIAVLCAFKNIKVGTDTASYVYYFKKIITFSDFSNIVSTQGESGYWFLNFLGHFITDNYFIIFSFTAIIVTTCYFYSLKTFNLKTLSLISLLLIGPYYFQLNGNRQAIAIAIFAVSVIFIIKKQPIRFIASILIGFLFHKSMIICLPLYYVFKGEIRTTKIAIILLGFLILLIFFQSFINIASEVDARYSSYGDQQKTRGGVVVSLFNILLLVWFVFCRKINAHILATKIYDTFLVIYLLGALISLLSVVLGVDPSGFLRMSLYFIQMNIFLLPMTINSFRDNNTRYIISISAVFLMVCYFYLTTSTFSNLTPYTFNPIIERLNES